MFTPYTRRETLLSACVPEIITRCGCSEYLHAAEITSQLQYVSREHIASCMCIALRHVAARVISTVLHLRVT
jgi:hypothetical protein